MALSVINATCEGCYSVLDARGRYRAACTLSGRVKRRATPTERVLAHFCRETDALVRFHAYVRDMNVGVAASDGRRVEVLAQDFPCVGGAQDITHFEVFRHVQENRNATRRGFVEAIFILQGKGGPKFHAKIHVFGSGAPTDSELPPLWLSQPDIVSLSVGRKEMLDRSPLDVEASCVRYEPQR